MRKTIDARGMACPQPVIMAKQALKGMKEGVLEIKVDDEIAVQNLMKFGKYTGCQVSSQKNPGNEFQVLLLLGSQENSGEAAAGEEEDLMRTRKGRVVVISSDCMGGGDRELGKILMKGFLYALMQCENLPETLLLYNGGARLSTEGAETLEDLKCLEEQGVEVLTCGTCLNYYGLTDKLSVGGVTNLYDIAQKLTAAVSIVRP